MIGRPTVEELEHLYASLTRDERDELLQELLVAGAHGGQCTAMCGSLAIRGPDVGALAFGFSGLKPQIKKQTEWRTIRAVEPMTEASQTKTSTRMTGAERKKRIVAAAEELVAEYGVQGATTARIAAAAGIAEKTLYSHFASRRDILVAALDAVFDRARDAFRRRTDTNALEHLRSAAGRHWPSGREFVYPLFEFFAAPPEAGLRGELRIRHQASIDLLVGIVEEGKAQGVIRPDVDSEQTAWEFLGVYWAEDVAYMIGFDEFASSGRSAIMLERILRDISA